MSLNNDPAVGSWLMVSRYGETMWLQVASAANQLAQCTVVFASLSWPNPVGSIVPVNYAEVLNTSAPGAAPTQPDVLAGDPPPGGTTGY